MSEQVTFKTSRITQTLTIKQFVKQFFGVDITPEQEGLWRQAFELYEQSKKEAQTNAETESNVSSDNSRWEYERNSDVFG